MLTVKINSCDEASLPIKLRNESEVSRKIWERIDSEGRSNLLANDIKFTVKRVLCQLYGNASWNLIYEMFVPNIVGIVEKVEKVENWRNIRRK